MKKEGQVWLAGLLIFLSRIPFLFDGYGSEEDAWALRLVAQNIAESGIYEVSRLPGHPLQELVYALIWKTGALGFNLLTAFISSIGIIFFMKTLLRLKIKNAILAGFILASIPIVYINSVNAMDYTWAMAFILMCFYFITNESLVLAGIFLGLATACRITSAMFGLPFLLLLYQLYPLTFSRKSVLFTISSAVTALMLFVPVIKLYGSAFFTYYEHFPIPGFSKNFYKGVLAVWGLPFLMVLTLVFFIRRKFWSPLASQKHLLQFCLLSGLLILMAFFKVPLKAAFMVPIAPVVVLALSALADEKSLKYILGGALASCFLFGLNLDDPLRGSYKSSVAFSFRVNGNPVVLDPLQGLLTADRTKKIQRTAYATSVYAKASTIKKPSVVIAGWWLADLLVMERENVVTGVEWRCYVDEAELRQYIARGCTVYYLPEQNTFNDVRFKSVFTNQYAVAF